MGDFRTRKRPPPRGEEGAGLRGERPLVAQLEFVHAPRLRQPVGATKIGQLDELADVVPEQCGTTAGAHPCSRGALAALDHHLNTHGLIRHLRRAPCIPAVNGRAVEREDFRVNVASGGAGFCCVCHASDITPTRGTCATLPRLTSQVTLTSLLVCSSLSGILPTHRTPDAQLLAPTTTSAASDIPLAQRMVVPATVYTWHTAAQVLRPASDMPHGSGRRTCHRGRRADHP